jgi:hypothetical protein
MAEVPLDGVDYGYADGSHAAENRIQVQLSNLRPAYPRRDAVEWPRNHVSVVPEPNQRPFTVKRRTQRAIGKDSKAYRTNHPD